MGQIFITVQHVNDTQNEARQVAAEQRLARQALATQRSPDPGSSAWVRSFITFPRRLAAARA